MPRKRLDVLLVERGLAESRAQAQALIMAGEVRVDGQVALKPATSVEGGAVLQVAQPPRFVSRGGEKLDAALEAFHLELRGRVCADVGASTGGFTDCLLQRGAAKVYAVDVGKGILHWKLRKDPRVVVMEQTNARFVWGLPEPVSLITLDASFISLKILLPVVQGWFSPTHVDREEVRARAVNTNPGMLHEPGGLAAPEREIIALIKPQFEAGRKDVSRGDGVIRDANVHRQVLLDVLGFSESHGLGVRGLIRSPLLGPKGNVEFLAWMDADMDSENLSGMIEKAMDQSDTGTSTPTF